MSNDSFEEFWKAHLNTRPIMANALLREAIMLHCKDSYTAGYEQCRQDMLKDCEKLVEVLEYCYKKTGYVLIEETLETWKNKYSQKSKCE